MLTYLKAENFQKHERLEIDFTQQGLTLICGENWAGKTTILRAVLYGLFGPSGVPGGARAVQRRGVSTKPTVELGFKLDAEYRVRRTASVTRLFKQGPGMIANGTRPVNQTIRELLGMDAPTFGLLKYAPQEQAGAILTLGAEKLSNLINQITGVTLVEQVIEKASHEGGVARSMQEQLEVVDPEPLKQELVALRDSLQGHHVSLEGLKIETGKLSKTVQETQRIVEHLEKRWRHRQEQQNNIAVMQGRIQTINKFLSRLPKPEHVPDRKRLHQEVEELQDIYNEEVSRGTQLREIYEETNLLEERRQKLKQELGARLTEYEKTYPDPAPDDEKIEELLRLQNEAYEKARSAYDNAQKLSKLAQESVCPTCERPLEGVDLGLLNERKAQAVAHNATCSKAYEMASWVVQKGNRQRDLEADFKAKEKEIGEIVVKLDALRKKVEQLSTNDRDFSQLEDALKDAKTDLQAAEVAYQTNLRIQKETAAAQADLKEITAHLAEAERTLETVCLDEVEQGKTELKGQQEKLQRFQIQYQKDAGTYREKYARYEALYARYETASESQRRLAELQARAKLCGKLAKYLRTNRDRFTKQVWEALLISASSFAQLATDGAMSKVIRTDGGSFEYVEDGHRMSVEAASGVQRAIIGVGVRLAIAEALRSPVNFLLLDEVTAGATDQVSLAMCRALGYAQQQVLMVTHRQSDAAVAERVISI